MKPVYNFLPDLLLRAPYYSFNGYDLERLPEVLAAQVFRNAIFLASPGFYRELEKRKFDFKLLSVKEKHTLYKYYNRMCFRPTPFGSFASFTLLEWGNGEPVKLCRDDGTSLHLLPDLGLLAHLNPPAEQFEMQDILIKNPVLYHLAQEYRFVKSIPDAKGHYRFILEALPAEKFNTDLLSRFGKKPVTAGQLISWIEKRAGCTMAEGREYLAFLLREQILFTAARGSLINLKSHAINSPLPGWSGFWSAYGQKYLPAIGSLDTLSGKLEGLMPETHPIAGKQYYYASLEKSLKSGGPGGKDKEEISLALAALERLAIASHPVALKQFIKDFQLRFDLEKVPLLLALDPDAGISYNNLATANIEPALLENIRFPEKPVSGTQLEWTEIHRFLFLLWGTAKEKDKYAPLRIRQSDLNELSTSTTPGLLPQTLAVMFRKSEDHLLIEHAGGAAATALIGRFSAFSEDVSSLCRKLAKLEEAANPNIVFADIGQLSDTHVDNINRRKQIYDYEIPINVYSGLPENSRAHLSDLLVSVQNGELILESVNLSKRVIPRLASAYNYQNNDLAVFRFLCDLQYQGLTANLTFDLEMYFPGMSFYPRVYFERTILAFAKWKFKKEELGLLQAETDESTLHRFREFRERHSLPQRVSTGYADQQLVFDLANEQEALFFLQCLKGLKDVTIQEYLLPGKHVKAGNKPLAAQYIAFLSHDQRIYLETRPTPAPPKAADERDFILGGNWLYLKIYCTPESANQLIAKVIWPFIHKNYRLIDGWFFIRFSDDGHHLRLRLKIDPENLGFLLIAFKTRLKTGGNNQMVKEYRGDIYRREVERYGSAIIGLVEEVFNAGSELVSKYISLKENEETMLTDFQLGILSAYQMIACFLDNLQMITAFTESITNNFLKEFSADKSFKMDIDLKYRSLREEISLLLERGQNDKDYKGNLKALFRTLNSKMKKVWEAVKPLAGTEREKLLADLVHMQMNRTFQFSQRRQEFMVYYCIYKHTASLKACQRKAGGQG